MAFGFGLTLQHQAIFQRIDEDNSGQVTFEELVEGARKDKEFQSRQALKFEIIGRHMAENMVLLAMLHPMPCLNFDR